MLFKLLLLGFSVVNSMVIKGSFWDPSAGNSCGLTDPNIWSGYAIALSPLSPYYGRDTVSPGPD